MNPWMQCIHLIYEGEYDWACGASDGGGGGGAGDTEVVAPVPPRQKCFFSGDVTGDISGYILPTLIVKFIM